MDKIRKIKSMTKGRKAIDGAGVHLTRVLGYATTKTHDPFLMLDAFDSTNPNDYIKGFPWHPHRGIETVTYLIEGKIEHQDSLGNKGVINDGDCQWMTAGSGIIHQEMPKESKRILGCQLWLNLPAKYKMVEPHYGDILKANVPVYSKEGYKVHVIAGEYLNTKGAFEGKYVKANYLDVELEPNTEWSYITDEESTLFIYIFTGVGIFNDSDKLIVESKNAVLFDKGNIFKIKSGDKGIRFILLNAFPIKESIAWGGPIVMNTEEELNKAFEELGTNTFIKHTK